MYKRRFAQYYFSREFTMISHSAYIMPICRKVGNARIVIWKYSYGAIFISKTIRHFYSCRLFLHDANRTKDDPHSRRRMSYRPSLLSHDDDVLYYHSSSSSFAPNHHLFDNANETPTGNSAAARSYSRSVPPRKQTSRAHPFRWRSIRYLKDGACRGRDCDGAPFGRLTVRVVPPVALRHQWKRRRMERRSDSAWSFRQRTIVLSYHHGDGIGICRGTVVWD